MSQEKRLFLLDAYALIFRAYFAFIRNPRVTSKGMDTSAVFGFALALLDLLEKENPSHVAVVFDTSAPTKRHEEYPEYKANRDETPEAIKIATPLIKKMLEGFGIPTLGVDGYEADDVIGTLAKKAEAEGYTTYMMTPDKDFGQLVTDKIFMYKPAKGGAPAEVMGVAEVCAKFGVERTEQVIDFLGMMGDSVDNIPGLPGVGQKTAQKLLAEYGSMENLLDRAEEVKGKLGEKIRANKELGILSKRLATIMVDAPVELDEAALKRSEPDQAALKELFEELEFRTLLRRIAPEANTQTPAKEAPKGGAVQGDLFAMGEAVTEGTGQSNGYRTLANYDHLYQLVRTDEEVSALCRKMMEQPSVCWDTETDSLDEHKAELVGIAFSWKAGTAYYVAFPEERALQQSRLELLRPFFEDAAIEKVGQNLKYDIGVLHKYNVEVLGPLYDTMLAHYLINPDMRHNFDLLCETYLGHKARSIEELIGKKGKMQKSMRSVPVEEVVEYAGEDADLTWQLMEKFRPMVAENKVDSVLANIELPLVPVLSEMERNGIRLDTEALQKMSVSMAEELQGIEKRSMELAGTEFNLASPRQLGVVLFDELKISDKAKKTKSGQYATSEDILLGLKDKHPIVAEILEYRQITKLKGTYVDALPELIDPDTGRIHTSFNQAVAATGRLSSNQPNLQNIPIRHARGREIRKAFIPADDDHVLLSADYSQIELRLIAELSQDQAMTEAFLGGADIHSATAARLFGIDQDQVDRTQRTHAKTVNFGIIYGVSAFGLSQQTDLSRSEAADLIRLYFETYPGIKAYMDGQVRLAREQGFVETLYGRRRYLKDINSRNGTVRGHAERNSVNAPIQGTAADVIKKAMIRIQAELKKRELKTRMLLQVHDELVFDCPKNEREEVQLLVKELMESAVETRIPLLAETGFGANWLEAH